MDDNESQFRLALALQVMKPEFFESIWVHNPFTARLMLQKFLEFLEDATFETIERHSFLVGFLKVHKNMEITNYLLTLLDNSKYKDEYAPIIMDWTLQNSENLVQLQLEGPNADKYSWHPDMKPLVKKFNKLRKRQKNLQKAWDVICRCRNMMNMEEEQWQQTKSNLKNQN